MFCCQLIEFAPLGSGNLFGGEFDGYDLQGGEFERGMEDVEVPREAEGAGPGALHEVSEKDGSGSIVVSCLCEVEF